jgi:hypothetical protein
VAPKCPELAGLQSDVENVLANLAQITTLQLELFRAGNMQDRRRLDRELELTVGKKERSIGALRQHIKEHNCRAKRYLV